MIRKLLIGLFFGGSFCFAGTPQIIFSGTPNNTNTTLNEFSGIMGADQTAYNQNENVVVQVDPGGGTWSNLNVKLNGAPGAAKSYQFLFRTNFSSANITCTISGTSATTCSDVSDSSTTVAGDLVSIEIIPTGTPTAIKAFWSIQYNPTTPNHYILMGNGTTSSGATVFTGITGNANFASASAMGSVSPMNCTFQNIFVWAAGSPGAGRSETFSLDTNGGASTISCALSGATQTTCSDVVDSSVSTRGDVVQIQSVPAGTPTLFNTAVSIVCAAATSGQFPIMMNASTGFANANRFGEVQAGNGQFGTTDSVVNIPASSPNPGVVLGNLIIAQGTAPGGTGSYAWTVRQNGASPGLGCSITGSAVLCTDTVDTITLASGDLINTEAVPTNTPGTTGTIRIGMTGSIAQPAPSSPSNNTGLYIQGGRINVQGARVLVQ